jgi:hypothetical protein
MALIEQENAVDGEAVNADVKAFRRQITFTKMELF